jgi:hypothetical protein
LGEIVAACQLGHNLVGFLSVSQLFKRNETLVSSSRSVIHFGVGGRRKVFVFFRPLLFFPFGGGGVVACLLATSFEFGAGLRTRETAWAPNVVKKCQDLTIGVVMSLLLRWSDHWSLQSAFTHYASSLNAKISSPRRLAEKKRIGNGATSRTRSQLGTFFPKESNEARDVGLQALSHLDMRRTHS